VTPLVFALPEHAEFAAALATALGAERGEMLVRRFPDGETYVRLLTSPAGRQVLFAGGLERPDQHSLALYFAASAARELGAKRIGLVAPYLAYMRQDARFNDGEAITSVHFAAWLSRFLDWLVTVDPHLHRYPSLDCVYSIPSRVVASALAISRWIRENVRDPLVIGPDAESAQWAQKVAAGAGCPAIVLSKVRRGDRDVEVSLPDIGALRDRTPVLIDDIISTARTLIASIEQLRVAAVRQAPICIGVHALFADDAYAELAAAGIARIITCNTIRHASNAIDVLPDIASAAHDLLAVG